MKLAASGGLIADDWQALVVTDQLGKRDDGKFAAVETGAAVPRQNGKGGCIEIRQIAGLYLLEERVVMYTAHQFKTAQEHFRRMKEYIKNSDEMSRQVRRISDAHGKEGIELYGTGRHRLTRTRRLMYLARSKGSGRGFTGDGCLFLDEAQYLTAADLASLIPTLSAVSLKGDPQLLYYGTPPDPAESADGGAYWVSVRRRGVLGTGRLCWHEYSPPEGFDRTDREVWRATNPAMGIRIDEEFVETVELEAMVAAGTPEVFDRERLGDWPPDASEGWKVFPRKDWEDAYDASSQVEDPVCFAVATNKARSWASIAIAGRRADGLWHVEVIDRRPSVAWVKARIDALTSKWRNCGVVLVQGGPAGAVIADLETLIADTVDREIELRTASTQDFAKACGMLHVALTGVAEAGDEDPRRVRHRSAPDLQEALTAAVKAAEKHTTGDVWTLDRDVDVDTSPLEAAVMALWGFAMFGQNAPSPPATVSPELRSAPTDVFRPRERLKL